MFILRWTNTLILLEYKAYLVEQWGAVDSITDCDKRLILMELRSFENDVVYNSNIKILQAVTGIWILCNKGVISFIIFLQIKKPNEFKIFTNVLFYACVGMHQLAILVFDQTGSLHFVYNPLNQHSQVKRC